MVIELLSIVKGGENIKKVLFALVILFLMIVNVSAIDVSGDLSVISDEDAEEPDIPDLYIEYDNNVTADNINRFFPNGILNSSYSDSVLNFRGTFNDFGVLTINQRNVTITGEDCLLVNTVFDVSGSNVLLSNISFILNESYYDNEYSAIFITSDNVTLNNIFINYTAPEDMEAYGIYSSGTSKRPVDGLTIVNSTILFKGQNFNRDVYNYALKLDYSPNTLIYNNRIDSRLVLRGVNFASGRVASDSDYSLSISATNCDNLVFVSNNVTSDAIGRSFGYPTLDCFFIWGCDNAYILNNSFLLTDFFTYKGVDNYLYALDIYSLDNLTVAFNNISVITTGGKLSAGAAYPFQLTGPLSNVNILYNNLYSYSNGPNIGIYSSNSGGNTALYIMYNKINITGLAGEDSWALVAGIEGQDSNDIIMNNLIEVHSKGDVDENTNIYGISYSQSSPGNHSFDIINNTVLSDGFYSVYLESAVNSTITHNTLISYQDDIEDGSGGYKRGDGVHEREMSYNNLVFNEFDYSAKRANDIDSGYVFNYTAPDNVDNISNIINGSGISGRNIFDVPDFNPLIRNDTIRHHTNGGAASNYEEEYEDDFGGDSSNSGSGDVSGNSTDIGDGGDSSDVDVSGNSTDVGGNSSDVDGGNSSIINPNPIPLPLPVVDDSDSTDDNENTNSSSEDATDSKQDIEVPDVADGDNGYVEDYEYHPRNPSKNPDVSNSTNKYNPSAGNYSKEGGLDLLGMLVSYVNSNTEGGDHNVSSYGGKTRHENETYTGPSMEGEDSSISDSKSVDASDSTEDSSSESGGASESSSNSADSASKNVYELDSVVKKIEDNIGLAIVLIILCLIFLVVGYKRQNSN